MVDPVVIYFDPSAEDREILPDELKKLTDGFREAVIEELGDTYPVVDNPAADVLRIRCAITDVVPSNAALNVATSLVAFVPVDMGGAAIEALVVRVAEEAQPRSRARRHILKRATEILEIAGRQRRFKRRHAEARLRGRECEAACK